MSGYRFGIEEEYFVIDLRTRRVRSAMSKTYYRRCKKRLGSVVTTELLQAQIEVAIPPCRSMAEAEQHLRRCRMALNEEGAHEGIGIVASGTFPLAEWREQLQTRKARYDSVMSDLQMLGLRNMLCGMHVHVEMPEPARRVEVMYRLLPYLPILLALSASSPFWRGRPTGLHAYRLAAYDELPRTGLPELFRTTEEYDGYVRALSEAGIIKDASFIWWAIRPSMRYPTLELRIADVCPRLEDALCIAALYRCLVRHLVEHPAVNRDFTPVDRAIAVENKWRAQRYGHTATLVDHETRVSRPLAAIVADLLDRLAADSAVLDCRDEIAHAHEIVRNGTSAALQVGTYREARDAGATRRAALAKVVDGLRDTTRT